MRDGRVAIVAGVRTPFVKRNTLFRDLTAVDLGAACVAELIARTGIARGDVDQLIYGQVTPSAETINVAREVGLRCDLPVSLEAYSVSRACATGYQALVSAADAIRCGHIDVAICGGADSASDVPLVASPELVDALGDVQQELRAKGSLTQRARSIARQLRRLRPRDLIPRPPALVEPATGLSMGQSAEKMAKDNHIGRREQDEFAHRSHTLAAQAWERGAFDDQVMPVYVAPDYEQVVERDNLVRHDSSLEALERLPPVFDRVHGTITAGNSSPLSDGASALLVMSEERADDLDMEPLGFVRSHAFIAVDPRDQLLIGPVDATPIALERAGVALEDMDLIDMHEAFAAQMLSVLRAFESRGLGKVSPDRLNVNGGSIALGHPFAATGGRQILQTLNELRRRGGDLALCTACAAGGLGAAVVLEAA